MQLVENSIIFVGENKFWSLLFVFRGVKEDDWPFSMGIFCNKIPNLCQLILSKYYECSQNAPLIIKALQSSASKKVMQQRSWIWVGVKVSPSQLLLQICYYQELGTYVLIIIIPVFLLYVHFLLLFFQYLFCFLLFVSAIACSGKWVVQPVNHAITILRIHNVIPRNKDWAQK